VDAHSAATLQRLDRVGEQVAQHQLDLQPVDIQGWQRGLHVQLQFHRPQADGFSCDAPQHRFELIAADILEARGAGAEEVAQAPHHVRGALRLA